MTQSRYATRSTAILPRTHGPARHRRGSGAAIHHRCAPAPDDIDGLVLEAAKLVLTQLRVLRTLVDSPAEARRLVADVHGSAVAHGIAPVGAIGVIAVLADLLCRPDEAELAETLVRAHRGFSDQELIDGAAAMLTATSTRLGQLMGLDPAVVGDEVASHRTASIAVRASA